MSLFGKMTARFAGYFIVFYSVVLAASVGLFTFSVYGFLQNEGFSDIRDFDAFELESEYTKGENGQYTFSEKITDIARRGNGSVQLIDQQGRVLADSTAEKQATGRYSLPEIVDLSRSNEALVWKQEDGKYVLFLEKNPASVWLDRIVIEDRLMMTDTVREELAEEKAVVEVYTADGVRKQIVVGQTKPVLTQMDVLAGAHNLMERKELTASRTLETGDIAVFRMKNDHYYPFEPALMDELKKIFMYLLLFHLLLFVFTIIFSFLIGSQFGRPILYFLQRIEKLAKHDYTPVEDGKLRRRKTGRFKSTYRVYEEVDQSLSHLAATLETNERQIKQTEKLREDWITGLSHDLKTPLSSIYGFSSMLSSDEYDWKPQEVKKYAGTIREKSTYMNALIEELTYTYQLKHDALKLHKKRVHMPNFVNEYIENSSWGHELVFQASGDIYALIDKISFKRILDNVIGNAVKHTPDGTEINIDIQQMEDHVVLTVQDNGEGISEEELERLFDRYYRGTNTTSDTSGTGLGLAITKQLIEAHNGNIHVESDEEGTRFSIYLEAV